MIDRKITDLETLNDLDDTDKLLVGTQGDTYNVSVQTLRTNMQAGMVPDSGWGSENSGRVLAVSDNGNVELGGYWIPAVRYNESQNLNSTEKTTARNNIDVPSNADLAVVENNIDLLNIDERLLSDVIKGTTQTPTFSNGVIQSIVHREGNNVVRTDTFNLSGNPTVETRTLSTGEVLTISTNTTTLVSTITYTPASA